MLDNTVLWSAIHIHYRGVGQNDATDDELMELHNVTMDVLDLVTARVVGGAGFRY